MSVVVNILLLNGFAAIWVVFTVIFLAIEMYRQNQITRAQIGHSTAQRKYYRYVTSASSAEFGELMAKDWASPGLSASDPWRIALFICAVLVDMHDVYEKSSVGLRRSRSS